MSTWLRLAMEQFPELKEDALVPVETLVDLYCELSRLLDRALRTGDDSTVQRVIRFALWGATQIEDEQFLHNTYDLCGRVAQSPSLRTALWRQLTPKQFAELKPYFHNEYGIKPEASLKELEQEYRLTARPNQG